MCYHCHVHHIVMTSPKKMEKLIRRVDGPAYFRKFIHREQHQIGRYEEFERGDCVKNTWVSQFCPRLGLTLCFPGGPDRKESACSTGDQASYLGWKIWRREWLSTPVFLPGEFRGQSNLASYSPWYPKSQT